ncbi:MAG TPA: replication-relaxation family protein [Herpetosiphonaceae bacterium]
MVGNHPICSPQHDSATPRVLATLAQLGCATLAQLHALCFPEAFASTVRLALMALMEAGLITHSHWRLRHGERCHVWAITTKGLAQLRQERPSAPQRHPPDLNRPSTPRETEEWRVRIDVRTLVVQFILETRQRPVCASANLSASLLYPTPLPVDQPPQPDAVLSIVWEPGATQAADWLPWLSAAPDETETTRYLLYVERQGQHQVFERWIRHGAQDGQDSIPLLILATPERCAEVTRLLSEHVTAHPTVCCSRDDVGRGVLHAPWRDLTGEPWSFQPERTRALT